MKEIEVKGFEKVKVHYKEPDPMLVVNRTETEELIKRLVEKMYDDMEIPQEVWDALMDRRRG